jgi:putative ATP-dependent endonuclease of OLD family
MNLLGKLRIPHSVLYDKDPGKNESLPLEKAITDSSNAFTRKIDFFAKDLETFLGVPPTKLRHRKPQHVMWYLKQGKIDSKNLKNLCGKIQILLDF